MGVGVRYGYMDDVICGAALSGGHHITGSVFPGACQGKEKVSVKGLYVYTAAALILSVALALYTAWSGKGR